MKRVSRDFSQVDVFSSIPMRGNPLAVVLEAEGLSDQDMQALASWTNLSETTFLLPPRNELADYRVRIFTPGGELPFAGHPTLGSAHAWLESGGEPKDPTLIIQECEAGLIQVRRDDQGTLAFRAPERIRTGPLDSKTLEYLCAGLGIEASAVIDHQWVDNGPGWAALQLQDASEVLALEPNFGAIPDVMLGVIGAYPKGSETDYEIRSFAPRIGVNEDPVTGSLNASVAQWFFEKGEAKQSYSVSQGRLLGRNGLVHLSVDAEGASWVGGATTTVIRGAAHL